MCSRLLNRFVAMGISISFQTKFLECIYIKFCSREISCFIECISEINNFIECISEINNFIECISEINNFIECISEMQFH